jgi:4-hydroxy-tetrahydrodipicolinate synthase
MDRYGLAGIWPALTTPLGPDLSIDHEAFAAQAQALLAAGCGGLTPFGTTGEGPSFALDERRDALDALVAAGVPASKLLVSVSAAALPDVIALTRHAQDIGAWGVLLMPPFFFKGVPEAGIAAFYRQVLDATHDRPLRMVLYHIPQVAGVGLPHGVIAELAVRHPQRIVAIKDSAGDLPHALALARAFMAEGGPRIGVHVGHEPHLSELGRLGSGGAVSGLANFMPRAVRRLVLEPDTAGAAGELQRIEALLAALKPFSLIPALKAVMALRTGHMGWLRVRPPLQAVNEAELAALREILERLGLAHGEA